MFDQIQQKKIDWIYDTVSKLIFLKRTDMVKLNTLWVKKLNRDKI